MVEALLILGADFAQLPIHSILIAEHDNERLE